ncbi:MAG: hypothetical protein FJ145_15740 [Deltaproteobacteria bacterium]|nr:hypothetical protein [Deltaproteobacteria bacterium]
MQKLVALTLMGLGAAAAFNYGSETWDSFNCGKLTRDGEGGYAKILADRSSADDVLFTNPKTITACRDRAIVAAARQAIADKDFNLAINYLNSLSKDADGRAKAEAATLSVRLPEVHINWVTDLVDNGKLDTAITELKSMRKMYVKEQEVLLRVKALDARARILKAEETLKKGPVTAVLVSLRELDTEIPIEYRQRAETLIDSTVKAPAEEYFARKDYPSLFRWLAAAKKDVARFQSKAMEKIEAGYMAKVFDVPANVELKDTAAAPPIVAVESLQKAERTSLKISNDSGKNIAVQIVGQQPKHKFDIPIAGEKEIMLPSGEYVQLVVGGDGVRPHLGIFRIEGHSYRQMFTMRNQETASAKTHAVPPQGKVFGTSDK